MSQNVPAYRANLEARLDALQRRGMNYVRNQVANKRRLNQTYLALMAQRVREAQEYLDTFPQDVCVEVWQLTPVTVKSENMARRLRK